MGVAILIAKGPNEVEVPCRIFSNMETGKEWCITTFGKEESKNFWGYKNLYINNIDLLANVKIAEDYENSPLAKLLFTHYYDGCGGVGGFELKEVEFNTSFVGFDLD